jgi:carbon storage regulator CsrA
VGNECRAGRFYKEVDMALVLSRTPGEEIEIGDDIRIVLLSVNGQKATLAITAPGKRIDRKEVADAIRRGAVKRSNGPAVE